MSDAPKKPRLERIVEEYGGNIFHRTGGTDKWWNFVESEVRSAITAAARPAYVAFLAEGHRTNYSESVHPNCMACDFVDEFAPLFPDLFAVAPPAPTQEDFPHPDLPTCGDEFSRDGEGADVQLLTCGCWTIRHSDKHGASYYRSNCNKPDCKRPR